MANSRVVLKRSSVSGKIPSYDALDYGELALNYSDGKLYYRTSSDEINYFSVLNDSLSAVLDKRSYVIDTAGTNTLTVTYEVGYVDVHVNGVRLPPSDFTATNGYQVVISGLEVGDEVTLDGYKSFQVTTATKYDRRKYTATAGQDTFAVDYEVVDVGTRGIVQVFVNGILLKESEYTATNGTSVVLGTPAELDDVVECIGYSDFSILSLQADGTGLSYDKNTGTVILDSSSNNDPNTVVLRDGYGNFAANTIVAENGIITDSINTTANNPFTVSVDTGEGIATMTYDGSLTLGQVVVSDQTQGLTLQPNLVAVSGSTLNFGFWGTGKFTQLNSDGSIEVPGSIIPQVDVAYDLGSATNRFRDLYLSGNTINLGGASISATGDGKVAFTGVVAQELVLGENTISLDENTGKMVLPADAQLGDAKLPPVDLEILPEVLGIQVSATTPGDDIVWNWTWVQSTLPYARATITNSPQLSVPLYKKGSYTLDNFIAYETFGDLTQTHPGYLKWIDGAGTDNLVSWATYVQTTSSHPDINDGLPTLVQRYTILVPEEITLPTLTLPQGIGYGVSFDTAGSYTFGADMIEHSPMQGAVMHSVASGQNPNIGPMYRGATYTFHLDPSIENHPFYLTTDNGQGFIPGQYVGEYTSGVTGSRNNGTAGKETITFTVPMDAPDILYYQCGNHQAMRGVITIRDLAVEQNANGNYVLYFQHTHEGHKTPIEIRPIPSLVNQMCLVYSAAVGKFVPQDLSTYIENTPSFKAKIQEIAGTATLIDASGQPIVATVKIFTDPSYLPFAGNKAGDIAYTEDTNTVFIWDEKVYNWKSTKARNTDEVGEGSGNLYFTEARVQTKLGKVSGHILPETDLAYALGSPTKRFSEVYLSSNSVYLDEFSLSIDTGKFVVTDPNGNPTPVELAANSTSDLTEGSNLYYTDERAQSAITVDATLSKTGGQISLPNSGVTAASYGGASAVPVITVDAQGRVTSATTTNVDGVSGFSYTAGTNTFTITTPAGTSFNATGDLSSFTTDNLAEGTNLYYTDARVQAQIAVVTPDGGFVGVNQLNSVIANEVSERNTAISSAVASLVDSSPAALDTLNELAAALGDDPNFATTVSNQIGLKLDSADFNATFDTRLSSKSTSNLAEGSNLYFTNTRARSALSFVSGSGAYDSISGVITIPTNTSHLTNGAGFITSSASISGNAATASRLATARTIWLSGDITGSVSFDGSTDATITATILANSVALGTDTTGNYMVNVAAGTDIAVSHTQGEGSTATVSNTSTLQSVTNRGATTTNVITHGGLAMSAGTNVDQIYAASASLTLTTSWQDTGINGAELVSGSYIVQVESVSDSGVGGQQYQEYYTGVMSWFSGNTNSTSTDEIVLHRAGHAPNAGALFLRVIRTASADPDDLKLQISGLTNNTGAYTYNFKFRRLI